MELGVQLGLGLHDRLIRTRDVSLYSFELKFVALLLMSNN